MTIKDLIQELQKLPPEMPAMTLYIEGEVGLAFLNHITKIEVVQREKGKGKAAVIWSNGDPFNSSMEEVTDEAVLGQIQNERSEEEGEEGEER